MMHVLCCCEIFFFSACIPAVQWLWAPCVTVLQIYTCQYLHSSWVPGGRNELSALRALEVIQRTPVPCSYIAEPQTLCIHVDCWDAVSVCLTPVLAEVQEIRGTIWNIWAWACTHITFGPRLCCWFVTAEDQRELQTAAQLYIWLLKQTQHFNNWQYIPTE